MPARTHPSESEVVPRFGGQYFDETKMHVLDHQGRFFRVRGPLSVAGMPQGHPVIVQAGASEQGRELGAATADVIYVYPLDGSVPADAVGSQDLRSVSGQLIEQARQENLTIRQLYLRGGLTGSARIGTPTDIADTMQAWFEAGACDGFNITPATLPGGGDDFVDMVVPELQRHRLFRTGYEGATLRENLGLRPVINRYSRDRQAATRRTPHRVRS